MVHPINEESQWLNRVYGRSMEKLQSHSFFGFPPAHHQRGEAVATFSVMKEIARKRNPRSLAKLNELERLCLNALDGVISTKQFAHGCRRIAKEAAVTNPIADFMDDLVINQSDVRKQSKAPKTNDPWASINRAFDSVQPKRKGPAPKSAFDFTVPALADLAKGNSKTKTKGYANNPAWQTKNNAWGALDNVFAKNAPPPKARRVLKNDFWNTKNPALDILLPNQHKKVSSRPQPRMKQVDPFAAMNKALGSLNHSSKSKPSHVRGSRRSFDPWAVRNPAFEKGKKNKPYAHMDKVWKQVLGGK